MVWPYESVHDVEHRRCAAEGERPPGTVLPGRDEALPGAKSVPRVYLPRAVLMFMPKLSTVFTSLMRICAMQWRHVAVLTRKVGRVLRVVLACWRRSIQRYIITSAPAGVRVFVPVLEKNLPCLRSLFSGRHSTAKHRHHRLPDAAAAVVVAVVHPCSYLSFAHSEVFYPHLGHSRHPCQRRQQRARVSCRFSAPPPSSSPTHPRRSAPPLQFLCSKISGIKQMLVCMETWRKCFGQDVVGPPNLSALAHVIIGSEHIPQCGP